MAPLTNGEVAGGTGNPLVRLDLVVERSEHLGGGQLLWEGRERDLVLLDLARTDVRNRRASLQSENIDP